MEINNNKPRVLMLFAALYLLSFNNYIICQSWSIEYTLFGDSSVYSLSRSNVLQGQSVDFFFPAYKFYQTSTSDAIESVNIGKEGVVEVEVEIDTENYNFKEIDFEIDIYTEEVDTIKCFMKTTDNHLIEIKREFRSKEYKYLPTIHFSVNLTNEDIKSILITGKSQNGNNKFVVGRLNGIKRIAFVAENLIVADSFASNHPIEKQSDIFTELPDFYLRFNGFYPRSRLVLKDCCSTNDSIHCISQFINKILNDYELYDVYGINKQTLIYRNNQLAKTVNHIDDYYHEMKFIISELNSCHISLSTGQRDDIEAPLQAVYFYNINNEIAVSAIFDPTLDNKIQLGDRLVSINHISVNQLYKDFLRLVFASTPQQREIKITQKLLYLARELFGDNLLLELANDTIVYSVSLNYSNFVGKKVVPDGFKILSGNTIEKYNEIVYLRPVFNESHVIPFLFSHMQDIQNSTGLIIDFRGCSSADFSFCNFLSYFIPENCLVLTSGSGLVTSSKNLIVNPSNRIEVKAPILFLVDPRTTCATELMINALRKIRSDCSVIGVTNTGGSAQLSMQIILPQSVTLHYFDGVTKDAFGNAIDNNIGIVPDTLLYFNSYKDLLPYEDNIKRYALKYFRYSFEGNDNIYF